MKVNENPIQLRCKRCDLVVTFMAGPMVTIPCLGCGAVDWVVDRATPVCDFCCGNSAIVCSYPAKNFVVETPANVPGARSLGWWACCADCRDLIEADDRKGLAERSAESYAAQGHERGTDRARLTQAILTLQDYFFENREGDPIPHHFKSAEDIETWKGEMRPRD